MKKIDDKKLKAFAEVMNTIAPGLVKIRTFIVDYNQDDIAKHKVVQVLDTFDDLAVAPAAVKEQFEASGCKISGILEAKGEWDVRQLEEIVRTPECPQGDDVIPWFIDMEEGMKTMEQDRDLMEYVQKVKACAGANFTGKC